MFIFYCDEFYITIRIIRNELFTLYIKIALFSKMKMKYSTDIPKSQPNIGANANL